MAKVGQRPPIERMIVQIDTVDIPNRIAHVITQRDGKIKVGFRSVGSAFQIPKQGERWIVERNTSWEWHLLHRQDRPDEHDSKTELEEGDLHIRAATGQAILVEGSQVILRDPENKDGEDARVGIPGDFLLEIASLHLRKIGSSAAPGPIGFTRRERRVTTGSTTTWALANLPVHIQTVLLFNNGVLVDPDDVTLVGSTLHFPAIAISHTLVAQYQTLY